jgi:hypothetical protein
MHVVLGVVSDMDVDITVRVGGIEVGTLLRLRAGVPHPVLVDTDGRAWPLVSPAYHEISLENLSRVPCAIHTLGVRLKKNESLLVSDTLVPGVCRIHIHKGICDDTNEYLLPMRARAHARASPTARPPNGARCVMCDVWADWFGCMGVHGRVCMDDHQTVISCMQTHQTKTVNRLGTVGQAIYNIS